MQSSQRVIAPSSSQKARSRELTVSGNDLLEGGNFSNDHQEVHNGAVVEESPSRPAEEEAIVDRVVVSGNKVIRGGTFGNKIRVHRKDPERDDSLVASVMPAPQSVLQGARLTAEPNPITADVPTIELNGLPQKLTLEQLIALTQRLLDERCNSDSNATVPASNVGQLKYGR